MGFMGQEEGRGRRETCTGQLAVPDPMKWDVLGLHLDFKTRMFWDGRSLNKVKRKGLLNGSP